MSLVHDAAEMIGSQLQPGQTAPNKVCPVCGGGKNKERSFSVTKYRNGTITFNCFRATCSVNGGYLNDTGYKGTWEQNISSPKKEYKVREFTGSRFPLADKDFTYFSDRFNIDDYILDKYAAVTGDDEYLFSVLGQDYKLNGYVIRQPAWKGEPPPPRSGREWAKVKSLTLMHEEAEAIAFYKPKRWDVFNSGWQSERDALVIVEDQVSAMRVASEVEHRSVALLGTTLNMARVREISRESKHVILALDADATSKAFKMAQTWGPAFSSFRVAILDMDIKDLPPFEVKGVLGL